MRPDSVAVVFFKLSKRSFSDDGINLLKISPFGVIPSDIHIVNESISNQLNNQGHPTNLFLTLSVPQRNLAGWQKYRCFDELAGKFCY